MKSEPLVTDSQEYLLQKQVFGLSICCPFDQGNPCACPLHGARKMGIMERYKWLYGQSDESLLDFLTFHQTCLEEKEN